MAVVVVHRWLRANEKKRANRLEKIEDRTVFFFFFFLGELNKIISWMVKRECLDFKAKCTSGIIYDTRTHTKHSSELLLLVCAQRPQPIENFSFTVVLFLERTCSLRTHIDIMPMVRMCSRTKDFSSRKKKETLTHESIKISGYSYLCESLPSYYALFFRRGGDRFVLLSPLSLQTSHAHAPNADRKMKTTRCACEKQTRQKQKRAANIL